MAEPRFRLPQAGFDQIARILKAYVSASRQSTDTAVSLDDVSRRSAINRTAVSANNAFLVSIGLLEGGNAKRLTPLGVRAALSLDHPGSPDAHQAWREVIERSPDLERVVDAVRIRQGMNEDALLSHIVLTAGVPKTSRSLTGARTIIDILEFGGLIDESDGVFHAPIPDSGTAVITVTPSGEEGTGTRETGPVTIRRATASGITVNVHVWVKAEDADFEELADQLKEFLSKLSAT